jgi:hypothetical protein
MAINFIKNVSEKKVDPFTHHEFVRYSIGSFDKEPFTIQVGKNIKIQSGFEYVNTFCRFLASIATTNIEIGGAIPTAKDVLKILQDAGLKVTQDKRFGKKGAIYNVQGSLTPQKTTQLLNSLLGCYTLLDLTDGSRSMKVKKKETPKLGSPSEKFVTVVLPLSDLPKIIAEFLFDQKVTTFSSVQVLQTYEIVEIKVDEKLVLVEPERARTEALRKGRIIRRVIIDGKESKTEIPMEV